MKTAILVDALSNRGGVERIVLRQAKLFNADIYAGRYSQESTFEDFKSLPLKVISKKPIIKRLGTLDIWRAFSRLRLKGYSLYILHGAGSLNAAKNHKPNIWYCHSPSRYLYDLYEEESKRIPLLLRPGYSCLTSFLRKIDQRNARETDMILANSKNVAARVKRYYNLGSNVVYPFADTSKIKYLSQGDFYLSSGRLDRIKRVDLAVKAFLNMPEKKLVVASSGPEESSLKNIASGAKNIAFLGYVDEKKLSELYGKCIATIYLSYKEDFGMVPIESMAAGKPCIATNDGGFKETIIHEKTGFLIDSPENIRNVIKAVSWLDRKRAAAMREECENRAKIFCAERFDKEMLDAAKKLAGE